jgi:hypothetical protein
VLIIGLLGVLPVPTAAAASDCTRAVAVSVGAASPAKHVELAVAPKDVEDVAVA